MAKLLNFLRITLAAMLFSGVTAEKALAVPEGLGAFVHYSFASEVANYLTNASPTADQEVIYETSGATGFGGHFSYSLIPMFSAQFVAGYETSRTLTRTRNQLGTTEFNPKPELNFAFLETNAFFSPIGSLYFGGGLNYNFPTINNLQFEKEPVGAMGMQGGIGYDFFGLASLELWYRTVNFELNPKVGDFSYSRLWGVMIRLNGYLPLSAL